MFNCRRISKKLCMKFTNLALFLASFNDQFRAFKHYSHGVLKIKIRRFAQMDPLFVEKWLKWHFLECLINTLCHINNSLKSLWDNNRLRILEDSTIWFKIFSWRIHSNRENTHLLGYVLYIISILYENIFGKGQFFSRWRNLKKSLWRLRNKLEKIGRLFF